MGLKAGRGGEKHGMIRHGTPLKDRREKKQTTRSARRRFELEFADEGEIHPAEIRLIDHNVAINNGEACPHCGSTEES